MANEDDLRMTIVEVESGVDLRATQMIDESQMAAAMDARAAVATQTQIFRPTSRPPTPLLLVLDDGQNTGEIVRLRASTLVIGRDRGDLRLPHDRQVSNPHAEIVRRQEDDGRYLWYLRDLESTNGTYVRANRVRLKPSDEVLVGRRRFQFQTGEPPPAAGEEDTVNVVSPGAAADGSAAASNGAQLVEMTPQGRKQSLPLDREVLLGRDPSRCPGFMSDDPLLDPVHAKVVRETSGRWVVLDNQSTNGIWPRIREVRLAHGCSLYVGEQRMRFYLL